MQEKNNLKASARYIKGVGPKKAELLSRIGINTIEDILYYLPKRYEDRSSVVAIKDLKIGENNTVQGEIVSASLRRSKAGVPIFQAVIKDSTGTVNAVWFNRPYLADTMKKGDRLILYGRTELYDRLQLTQPEYEVFEEEGGDRGLEGADKGRKLTENGEEGKSLNIGRIVPVYALTEQLTQKYVRSIVFKVLSEYSKVLTEKLPTYIIARQKLVDIKFAIRNIHFPSNFQMLEKAYNRIVFEEFLVLQLALALRKKGTGAASAGAGHSIIAGGLSEMFKNSLPFELTEGQKKAILDIERDMSKNKPMNRLLEGDVGSGKTVVAAHALTMAIHNGFQAVLMAPTEVLARQHFFTLSELLMPLGVNVVLLIGGMEEKNKKEIYAGIKGGSVNIVVGTHALIQEGVEFNRLGLVVIDEQHKFGVRQRAALRNKGIKGVNKGLEGADKGIKGVNKGLEGADKGIKGVNKGLAVDVNPHVLIMTATPIPRTLALTVYGDLDMSVIKEMPKGRKPVVTYWIEEDRRRQMYRFVEEELEKGRQAYVVCPLIDKGIKGRMGGEEEAVSEEGKKASAAVETFEKLKNEIFKGYEVGLLHGRMNSKEKEKVMKDFKKGKIKVLVSTVVIEVGIDVPNATIMLIENAERFGLSQLHQLRGRIGRGAHESYCILLSNPKTDVAAERLKTIEGTLDGFEIAEVDMDMRGPGEIFGTAQHGLPEIRFGNIARDFDIMEAARKEAFALVEKDPALKEEHHRLLKAALAERFKGRLELIRVG
jgi:ATP-dependent DNA helicase RecG